MSSYMFYTVLSIVMQFTLNITYSLSPYFAYYLVIQELKNLKRV